jgi:predicted ABC-type ATPase
MKQLWILAGGNGAGKSTFYDRYLKNKKLSFVNADMIAKEISTEENNLQVAKSAQEQAMAACLQKIKDGETFCFETVFSHESKVELIKKAKELGYEVNLVFIHLSFSQLNIGRVVQRVASGGHNVPQDKIESRIPKTIENLKKAIEFTDNVVIIDNSSSQNPFRKIISIRQSKIIYEDPLLPNWAKEIILKLNY